MPKKHIHQYQRKYLGPNEFEIYRCMLPDCTHYVPATLAENRMSICPRCGDEFKLTKKSLLLVKPHCPNCTKGEKKVAPDIVADVLGKFGIK